MEHQQPLGDVDPAVGIDGSCRRTPFTWIILCMDAATAAVLPRNAAARERVFCPSGERTP